MSTQARGLQNFISDLRNAKSKEEEQRRVDKELANIRKKFTATGKNLGEDGSNTALNSYSRKKYVWKLVYIHVLGYDVDFGHAEVLALVRSNKYSEKHVGYTALSLLLRGDDPMMNSILNTIRRDLTNPGPTSAKKQCTHNRYSPSLSTLLDCQYLRPRINSNTSFRSSAHANSEIINTLC
jgi:AP-2 complex subunit alpha